MRFKGLDLNLLVALDALLEDRSVAKASRRLRLSQPATSYALARIREFFSDEILVLEGKRMYATPFAESLVPQVRECLRAADTLIATSTLFDPATSRRIFRIAASDYTVAALFAPMVKSLASQSLGIQMDFLPPSDDVLPKLNAGELDLFVTPSDFMSREQASELLFEERHVLVGWRDNSIFRETLTEEAIFVRAHVAVALGSQRTPAFSDRQLQIMNKPRQIELTVGSFTLVPWLLIGTERVALMHERLAWAMADHFPITFAPLPFDFPVMKQVVQFHRTRAGDDGLRWLIGQLKASVALRRIGNADRK